MARLLTERIYILKSTKKDLRLLGIQWDYQTDDEVLRGLIRMVKKK